MATDDRGPSAEPLPSVTDYDRAAEGVFYRALALARAPRVIDLTREFVTAAPWAASQR